MSAATKIEWTRGDDGSAGATWNPEPLLGPIDLHATVVGMGLVSPVRGLPAPVHAGDCCARLHGLDWVIAGGESGPRARPMHPDWVRSLRDQCQAAGTAFFFKQWGAFAPQAHGHQRGGITFIDHRGHGWNRLENLAPPTAVRMRCVGKKAAGRLLDGRTWDQFPTPPAPPTTAAILNGA